MPASTDTRSEIRDALAAFATKPVADASISLLDKLGYSSERTIDTGTISDFCAQFDNEGLLDHPSALKKDWESVRLLFQLTDEELSRHASLFKDTTIQPSLLRSYLFFAIELTGGDYARGKLTGIARQLNRLFPMPVMVFIKHLTDKRPVLSIAVINRRQNKRDAAKDVLGKVTIIRDISLTDPHRGHLDILASFAVPNLVHPQRLPINNFDTLHAAWEEIFNVELLNKRFYRELANWYFWALPQVEFPADIEKDDEKRRATGLIRLLTRLIFCWFLKEKGLIPEKLFVEAELKKILNDLSPGTGTYHEAILQNLFFATLNQRMGKDAKGQPYRAFAKDEGFQKNRATYGVDTLYRYEEHFHDPATALGHFADVPFLNGGLFECLDRTEEGTDRKLYLDGFSRNKKKRPTVPNRLFFGSEREEDLSEAYGDTKRKKEKVRGLLRILHSYKFTIVENTPIDQEIALDPELLGKVFENLLASYNEETKTTARKQTGSFYTPRPIVEYMVDESLKAHLAQKVEQTILSASPLKPFNRDAATHKTRRNLPHWTQEGTTYWITFRLADSLPAAKLKTWQEEKAVWLAHHPEPWNDEQWKEYDDRFGRRLDDWLDAGEGECHLRRPEVRDVVKKCLLHFDAQRYDLPAWVIMPNHVHLLIHPRPGFDLSKIVQGIKGVSAKECNALLGRTGEAFWQDESFDHIARSQAQFDRFVRYIAENPVKARLKEGEFSVAQTILSGSSASQAGEKQTGLSAPLSSRLDQLFSYTEQPHQFTESEVAALLDAIHTCKILDPACGSGAFPMGMLQKLVYIIHKLDPDNARWKQLQINAAAKIPDPSSRDAAITAIERDFADNEDDYGRKLYLIENCLYGVDIQPIAIQISKLRFFISLVCDQRTNRSKKENHGIRPLPNLETKFVAADTLIGLSEMDHSLLVDPRVRKIENEIETLYHSHFAIQRRDQKLALQRKIKDLRKELGKLLAESLMAPKKAQHVAAWDQFDPQATSDFFDPHWMFGPSLADGFDIVFGNPPWGAELSKEMKAQLKEAYPQIDSSTPNSFAYFVGAAIKLAKSQIAYVLPDAILIKDYAKTRRLLRDVVTRVDWYLNTGIPAQFRPFVYVEHDVCVLILDKTRSFEDCMITKHLYDAKQGERCWEERQMKKDMFILPQHEYCFNLLITPASYKLMTELEKGTPLGDITQSHEGIHTGNSRDILFHKGKINPYCKPLFYGGRAGDQIENYHSIPSGWFVDYRESLIDKSKGFYASLRDERIFKLPKIYITRTGNPIKAFFDCDTYASNNFFSLQFKDCKVNTEKKLKAILPLILSSIANYYIRNFAAPRLGNTYVETKIIHLDRVPVADALLARSDFFAILTDVIVASIKLDVQTATQFLKDLIDACVMECYFREHMAERDLLFLDDLAPHLSSVEQTILSASASDAARQDCLAYLHRTLNAPSSKIRNRLLRISADSPDLLAVIKQEGRV